VQRKGQQDVIFPSADAEDRAICVPGVGSKTSFSALVVDAMPDLGLLPTCQCFPRCRFRNSEDAPGVLPGFDGGLERVGNVSDAALRDFHVRHGDPDIGKDDIFDYVYGVLHAPGWRERFADDLAKQLPRIPLAPDFLAFAETGMALAGLHLGHGSCREHPLEAEFSGSGDPAPEHFTIGKRKMRFAEEGRGVLVVNDRVRLAGVPPEAHRYVVNGRTPLEWLIDRYRIRTDRESGIVNDPNGWFGGPPRPDRRLQAHRACQRRNRPDRRKRSRRIRRGGGKAQVNFLPNVEQRHRGADCDA